MTQEKQIQIGEIYREHGIKGEAKIYIYNPDSQVLKKGLSVILKNSDGRILKAVVDQIKPHQKWFVVKFSSFSNPETISQGWRKAGIWVEAEPSETSKEGFLLSDCLGFELLDGENHVGVISRLVGNGGNQEFLEVVKPSQQSILVPLIDAWVDTVDIKAKKLVMHLPEGLTEIE